MLSYLVLASLAISAHGAVLPPVPMLNGRVVGGTETTIEEAPYQVALLLDYYGSGSFIHDCGGSIITRNVILTAAHCTDGKKAFQWKIRAGSTQHNTGGQVISVDTIVQHSAFNSRLDNDIALLKLSANLDLGTAVATITLPSQGMSVSDNTNAVITGWGTLTEGGSSPINLYKVIVPTINQQKCVSAYTSYNLVTNNMLCAGRMEVGGMDACQGDSGGSLVINNVLQGITSWGRGCGDARYPGVYSRVAIYRYWINSNI